MHHCTVGWPYGRDDEGFLGCGPGNNLQKSAILFRSEVIEVGVASIEKGANSSLFDVFDDPAVIRNREREVFRPGQWGHGDHGGPKEFRSDRSGSHEAGR